MRYFPPSMLVAACALSAVVTAAPPVSQTGTTTATASGASGAAGTGRRYADVAASSLLCRLFTGTDLAAQPTVPPPPTGRWRADIDHAIEFDHLWTEHHQTTVGRGAPADTAPVVATVRLPIEVSAAERKQFQDAGWTAHYDEARHRHLYCLEGSKPGQSASSASPQGVLCVASRT